MRFKRRIDHGLELRVVALDRNADAVAEILGLRERSAFELAAGLRGRAVEPEREADPVIEQEVGGTDDERIAGKLDGFEHADRAVAEERAQVGLVRGALGDRDLHSLQAFGRGVELGHRALAGEAGGREVVAVREVGDLEGVGRHAVGGDDGFGLAFCQGRQQGRPRPHLDIAGGVELEADGARHVDIEAGQHVVFVEVVERRKVAVGEKADGDAPRRVAFGSFRFRRRRLRRELTARARQPPSRPTKSKTAAARSICTTLIRVRPICGGGGV